MTTLEQRAQEQKLRDAILAERNANHILVLNKHPGKGGGVFIPIPDHAIMFRECARFKEAGALTGFIKNDPPNTRLLIYPEAFRCLCSGCGLDHAALIAHLQRHGWLENRNEKVKGKTDRYYVLAEAFLRGETNPS